VSHQVLRSSLHLQQAIEPVVQDTVGRLHIRIKYPYIRYHHLSSIPYKVLTIQNNDFTFGIAVRTGMNDTVHVEVKASTEISSANLPLELAIKKLSGY
jgi:hypothetical protein